MVDLKKLQEEVLENKRKKGFNTTDVKEEFLYLYGEVGEAYMAYLKKKDDLGEELADIALFLLGISEILGFNLEEEVLHKIKKNALREYKIVDGIGIRTKEAEEPAKTLALKPSKPKPDKPQE